jgi:hypothetical protein
MASLSTLPHAARPSAGRAPLARRTPVVCMAESNGKMDVRAHLKDFGSSALALAAAAAVAVGAAAGPAMAEVRLPPLDNDPNHCDRGLVGNTIGQANGVSDKLLDLRQCSFAGVDLHGKTLSGALMVGANFSGANMQEVIMSKAYAVDANFSGADLTNAVVDRVAFDGSDLSNAKFGNAVVTGATFKNANLAGSVWDDALIGGEDAKRLCANPTLVAESRAGVGCRD